MNIALWIAQGILCAVFLGAGGMKVFAYKKFRESSEKHSQGRDPVFPKAW